MPTNPLLGITDSEDEYRFARTVRSASYDDLVEFIVHEADGSGAPFTGDPSWLDLWSFWQDSEVSNLEEDGIHNSDDALGAYNVFLVHERLYELRPWIAGWNEPGYLADDDNLAEFSTFTDAVAYLVSTVEKFWDEDGTFGEAPNEENDAADRKWLPVHTALNTATEPKDHVTDEFGAHTGDDQSMYFWIRRAQY